MLKVIDKIKKNHIFEDVAVATKDEALKLLSDKIAESTDGDKKKILSALETREIEESTGIGNGIAVPHGRIKGVKETEIFVAILKEEIDFQSLDGQKVKVIFVLIADEDNADEYVSILSQLIFLISQKDIMSKLSVAKGADDILRTLGSAKELESKYETEGQIKYLIELQRADSQVYAYELWESTQKSKNETIIHEYQMYKKALESKIDRSIFEHYTRIKEKYSGRALSKIENGTCSACHITIPKMTVNEVRRQNQIIVCFNCGRILFTN
ncbi:MAG: PTS sugar transporter subunit IIA [Spirochaetes bacterium]|nr:PTS sugar transporter subunit IIA [Spirochaetota bacterium]